MGSSIASSISQSMQKTMGKTMEKNAETMIENQQKMAMRRRELQMAIQTAVRRDNFWWYCSFTGTLSILLITGAFVRKNPVLLGPLIPFGFGGAFQYDAAYGNKYKRILNEATNLMNEEWKKGDNNRFLLPKGNLLVNREKYDKFMFRE